jgi:succinyl-CoA synthetase alpha subunit
MPVAARVKRNFYQDSVALMRISQEALGRDGLARVSLLMGTPANKDILGQAGLLAPELAGAAPADLMILVDGEEAALAPAFAAIEAALAGGDAKGRVDRTEAPPRSIAMGVAALGGAKLALIAVPGPYAAAEALKALKAGLHVFLFSDNVPLGGELAAKRLAARKGLLVMGPDCGTAILGGVPLGFANAVRRGAIGLVGASGTGMQEVSCRIHGLGEGVSHAIGTGSRDVYAEVGGTTLVAGLEALGADPATRVITIVSKPPAPSVAERALAAARATGKPTVCLFLGAKPAGGGNLHPAATLEEAAAKAVALVRSGAPATSGPAAVPVPVKLAPTQRFLRGLYSGGTYCTEAQLVWRDAGLETWSNAPLEKRLALPHGSPSRGHTAIDLGADEFTAGRPHPMIDLAARLERLAVEACDPSVAAIVLDVVLGYGAHPDPAGALAPAVRAGRAAAAREGRELAVIGFLCGTEGDPQGLAAQAAKLAESGVVLAPCSTAAARLAAGVVARR